MADWKLTDGFGWDGAGSAKAEPYRCGYCGYDVSSDKGWRVQHDAAIAIRVCPQCNGPTFFDSRRTQWPGPLVGSVVQAVPPDTAALYDEARRSVAANAFTGAVMLCRKILMHVAVEKSAKENQSFAYYVRWLADEHWIPPGAEVWVTYIKDRGNEANHEIVLMTRDDAVGILRFAEALLRNVYELPAAVPPLPPTEPAAQ
ncbi:MAG: DUF4145 domain-containing protein [Dehalococcoidia bacterium]